MMSTYLINVYSSIPIIYFLKFTSSNTKIQSEKLHEKKIQTENWNRPKNKIGIKRRKGTELTRSASITFVTLDDFMNLFPAKKNLQIIKEDKAEKIQQKQWEKSTFAITGLCRESASIERIRVRVRVFFFLVQIRVRVLICLCNY